VTCGFQALRNELIDVSWRFTCQVVLVKRHRRWHTSIMLVTGDDVRSAGASTCRYAELQNFYNPQTDSDNST